MARGPQEHFYDWVGLRPRGESRYKSMRAYYEMQDARLHSLNEAATIAGQRAGWAFRELHKLEKEESDAEG